MKFKTRWKILLIIIISSLTIWIISYSEKDSIQNEHQDFNLIYPTSGCNDSEKDIQINHFYLRNDPQNKNHSYSLRAQNPFTLHNPGLCYEEDSLDFLIIVNSIPEHSVRRKVLRSTWGKYNMKEYQKLGKFRVVFLIGQSKSNKIQKSMIKESKTYGDLIQGKFTESPNNLPQKALLGLRWTAEYCLKAKMIIRIQDTVILNMFELFEEYLPKYSCTKNLLMCHFTEQKINFMNRENLRKMNLSPVIPYCQGNAVIMTRDMLISLYHSAPKLRPYWSDDVYIFGMLPAQVQEKTVKTLKTYESNSDHALDCYETDARNCGLVAVDTKSQRHLDIIWHHIQDNFM